MVGTNNQKKQIVFLILPTVQILDLAGPVQALDEAIEHGAGYQLRYVAPVAAITSSQKLTLSDLNHFRDVDLRAGDLVVIPGIHGNMLGTEELDKLGERLYQWLREARKNGAKLCTVCNATFVLAHAGLLDNRPCTTHWKRVEQLRKSYPAIDVLDNVVTHFRSDSALERLSPAVRQRWLDAMEPIEPINFVGMAAPAPLLFQNGRLDQFVRVHDAEKYQNAGSEPKTIRWYDAGHGLPEEAFLFQAEWLEMHIGIDASLYVW